MSYYKTVIFIFLKLSLKIFSYINTMEKNDNYDDIMYQLQRQAVIIDVNNLLLIKDPSDELIHLAFSCDAMKFLGGVIQKKLTGNMLILKIKYESNLLKQRMMNKRKFYEFI